MARKPDRPKPHAYRVIFVCADCHRQTEVHMTGGWDIENVVHDCNGTPAFAVTFKPGARPVF